MAAELIPGTFGIVSAKRATRLPFSGKQYADLGAVEIPTSPQEQYTSQDGRALRTFRVRSWADRWDFAAYMLGWSAPVFGDGGAFRYIHRELPDVYLPTVAVVEVQRYLGAPADDFGDETGEGPDGIESIDVEKPWLWASNIERMIGKGRQTSTILPGLPPGLGTFTSFPEAEVEVSYEARHYRLTDDQSLRDHQLTYVDSSGVSNPDEAYCARYCSYHPQPQVLSVFVPQDGMKWGADAPVGMAGQPSTNESHRYKYTVDVQIQWYAVPGIPLGLASQLGTVNDRNWMIRPPGTVRKFEAHTLIYLGYRLHSYRQITGDYVHDISLLFSHFEEGHNKDLCFPPGGNYRWTTLGTASYSTDSDDYLKHMVYQESNFADLFRLPNRS